MFYLFVHAISSLGLFFFILFEFVFFCPFSIIFCFVNLFMSCPLQSSHVFFSLVCLFLSFSMSCCACFLPCFCYANSVLPFLILLNFVLFSFDWMSPILSCPLLLCLVLSRSMLFDLSHCLLLYSSDLFCNLSYPIFVGFTVSFLFFVFCVVTFSLGHFSFVFCTFVSCPIGFCRLPSCPLAFDFFVLLCSFFPSCPLLFCFLLSSTNVCSFFSCPTSVCLFVLVMSPPFLFSSDILVFFSLSCPFSVVFFCPVLFSYSCLVILYPSLFCLRFLLWPRTFCHLSLFLFVSLFVSCRLWICFLLSFLIPFRLDCLSPLDCVVFFYSILSASDLLLSVLSSSIILFPVLLSCVLFSVLLSCLLLFLSFAQLFSFVLTSSDLSPSVLTSPRPCFSALSSSPLHLYVAGCLTAQRRHQSSRTFQLSTFTLFISPKRRTALLKTCFREGEQRIWLCWT